MTHDSVMGFGTHTHFAMALCLLQQVLDPQQPKDTFDRRFLKRAKFNVASALLDIQRRFYKDLVRSPFLSCVISFVTVLLLNVVSC